MNTLAVVRVPVEDDVSDFASAALGECERPPVGEHGRPQFQRAAFRDGGMGEWRRAFDKRRCVYGVPVVDEPTRTGIGTRVVRKSDGRWRTVAVQNTDVRAGRSH